MKRLIAILLFLLLVPTSAFGIGVYINGQQLQMDTQPQLIQGSTLVPMRAIFEAMGASVEWDAATKKATGKKGNTTVILPLGSKSPTINGQIKPIDVPATLINNRTFAPLRFVGEAFGGSVRWDGATQTVYITSAGGEQIKVHYIDVGQADSIYIQLPGHNDILIDGGNNGDGDDVVSYLKAQGVDDLELVIATHPHEDHIGGLPDVYKSFVVKQAIHSGEDSTTQAYENFNASASGEGSYSADGRQSYTFGGATFEILTGAETWKDANNYSVVSRLDTGNIEFLFSGDAEAQAEAALTGDISAEILKVGHHGSDTSSSSAFLTKVKPQIAIIQVGDGNSYGHPKQETLTKLSALGAKIYRTDLNGNIVVTTDGDSFSVTKSK